MALERPSYLAFFYETVKKSMDYSPTSFGGGEALNVNLNRIVTRDLAIF